MYVLVGLQVELVQEQGFLWELQLANLPCG